MRVIATLSSGKEAEFLSDRNLVAADLEGIIPVEFLGSIQARPDRKLFIVGPHIESLILIKGED